MKKKLSRIRISLKNGLRRGVVTTNHGILKTPFFMPDATRGFVKQISSNELMRAGIFPMVVNTYHLYLQPGVEVIKKAGGIHDFMNWPFPLLSDSGGFQVFSLVHRGKNMGKITNESVVFKSPIDGSQHELTPEKSIQIQFDLGVDMMVCLDDCPPNNCSLDELRVAVDRTIAWAKRCRVEFDRQVERRRLNLDKRPLLFSVIQGGNSLELRKYCADELVKIGFDGYGFGAMPVSEDGGFAFDVLRFTANQIPKNSLRFALGIGNPEDIVKCYRAGWDMFDCVIPTREGRHGKLFLEKKLIKNSKFLSFNITNAKFKKDFRKINQDSAVPELKNITYGYLNHLFKVGDPLGQRLASLHNLEFYANLMKKIVE